MDSRALVGLIALIWLAPGLALAGFGISPPSIQEDHLVRGAVIERTIYLVQGTPDRDLPVEIVIDSRTMTDWFSFDAGQKFIVPKGVQQFPLKVKITVPPDVEFGVYTAYLRINPSAALAEGNGQVAIAVGGRIDVEVTVGEGIYRSINIRNIKIHDIAANQPLAASFVLENNGNVVAGPAGASFELFNKFGEIRLGFAETEEIDVAPAFTEKQIEVNFPLDLVLAEGEYWGHVKIYDEGGVLKELRTVFNVTPAGAWDGLSSLTSAPKFIFWLGPIILVALVIFGLWLKRSR